MFNHAFRSDRRQFQRSISLLFDSLRRGRDKRRSRQQQVRSAFTTEVLEQRALLTNLVGIDMGGGSPITGWTQYSNTSDTKLNNLTGETGPTGIDVFIDHDSSPGFNVDFNPPASQLPIHTTSLAGIDRAYSDLGNIEFNFSDLTPGQDYEIYVFAGNDLSGNQKVTITGATTDDFNQPHTVDQLIVNDTLGDSTMQLSDYAVVMTADGSGEIKVRVDSSPNPGGFFGVSGIAIQEAMTTVDIIVSNTADSGAGSLRQAIIDANAATDPATIKFEIPNTDPGYIDVDNGSGLPGADAAADVFRIQPLTASGNLPSIDNVNGQPITIDAMSQTTFGGDTNPNGPEVVLDGSVFGFNGHGLVIDGDDVTVQGFAVNNFDILGILARGDSNTIQGNYVGTDATGRAAVPNGIHGISVTGATNVMIGGTDADDPNLISGNSGNGLFIQNGSENVTVVGNLIGTDATGAAALGNVTGILIDDSSMVMIDGTSLPNVVSGNTASGISIVNGSSLIDIKGNQIGVDQPGTSALGNAQDGVVILDSNMVTIGGSDTGDANEIAYNSGNGVTVTGASQQARVEQNSIHSNTLLGVDLGSDGPTSNDGDDSDVGPNGLQNTPVLDGYISTGDVLGSLQSMPNMTFTIELFDNSTATPADAEGETFLTSLQVTTDATGFASFSVAPSSAPMGLVTATATDAHGNTSEFSHAVGSLTMITDDGDAGFAIESGSWGSGSGGFEGDFRSATNSGGEKTASWTFSGLASGQYRVSATWTDGTDRATDAPFTIFDGASELFTVDVDQEVAPADFMSSGSFWGDLGTVPITSGSLVVKLTNDADEQVIADAILIERLDDASLPVSIQNGLLSVIGTTTGDNIDVNELPGGNIEVTFNGSVVPLPLGPITSVDVAGRNGFDTLRHLGGTTIPVTLRGGNGEDTLIGNDADDTLLGGPGIDTIMGGDGNDDIQGSNGNDLLFGEGGNDTIRGGKGNDTLDGGDGIDTIFGGGGQDTIDGRAGNDILRGQDSIDTIDGGAGADDIQGGGANDDIIGGSGHDVINGNIGNDTIDGGSGEDNIRGAAGNDTINGDGDNDTLRGGNGLDTINGNAGDDTIIGGGGDDDIRGEAGIDDITGDNGNDTIRGGDDGDIINSGSGADTVFGGSGNDDIRGAGGDDVIDGEAGDDTIRGGSGNNILLGGVDNDTLLGDTGRDILIGGLGLDNLDGGAGDDILIGATTIHDSDIPALQLILAEWVSATPVATRVSNIRTGGGLTGGNTFDAGTSVLDDGAADTMTSATGDDWAFRSITDDTLLDTPEFIDEL